MIRHWEFWSLSDYFLHAIRVHNIIIIIVLLDLSPFLFERAPHAPASPACDSTSITITINITSFHVVVPPNLNWKPIPIMTEDPDPVEDTADTTRAPSSLRTSRVGRRRGNELGAPLTLGAQLPLSCLGEEARRSGTTLPAGGMKSNHDNIRGCRMVLIGHS
jgi:hypothetical protein